MYLDLTDIIFFMLLSFLGYFWWQSKAVKESAIIRVKRYCKEMDIQLLDETISTKKSRLIWHRNQLKIKRSFVFEFTSTGEARYEGEIIFLSHSMDSIAIEPHKI